MSKYFTSDELKCSCCGINGMSEDFMRRLDKVREHAQFPFIVTSAYRCPEYNKKVSSTGETGPHTTGKAIDIAVSGENAYILVGIAIVQGFTGIGVSQKGPHNKRFIHLDRLKGLDYPRPGIWSY